MLSVVVLKIDWRAAIEKCEPFFIDAADQHEFKDIYGSRWQQNQEPELIDGRRVIHCVPRK